MAGFPHESLEFSIRNLSGLPISGIRIHLGKFGGIPNEIRIDGASYNVRTSAQQRWYDFPIPASLGRADEIIVTLGQVHESATVAEPRMDGLEVFIASELTPPRDGSANFGSPAAASSSVDFPRLPITRNTLAEATVQLARNVFRTLKGVDGGKKLTPILRETLISGAATDTPPVGSKRKFQKMSVADTESAEIMLMSLLSGLAEQRNDSRKENLSKLAEAAVHLASKSVDIGDGLPPLGRARIALMNIIEISRSTASHLRDFLESCPELGDSLIKLGRAICLEKECAKAQMLYLTGDAEFLASLFDAIFAVTFAFAGSCHAAPLSPQKSVKKARKFGKVPKTLKMTDSPKSKSAVKKITGDSVTSPKEKTDPNQADSSQADPSQADPIQAEVSQAGPSQADVSQADSGQADVSQADLSQADLTPIDWPARVISCVRFAAACLNAPREEVRSAAALRFVANFADQDLDKLLAPAPTVPQAPPLPTKQRVPQTPSNTYTCDVCGQNPISSMRYHCHDSACSDVDLCHACFKRTRDFTPFPHARTHRDTHLMARVKPGERPEQELFARTCPANVDPEDDDTLMEMAKKMSLRSANKPAETDGAEILRRRCVRDIVTKFADALDESLPTMIAAGGEHILPAACVLSHLLFSVDKSVCVLFPKRISLFQKVLRALLSCRSAVLPSEVGSGMDLGDAAVDLPASAVGSISAACVLMSVARYGVLLTSQRRRKGVVGFNLCRARVPKSVLTALYHHKHIPGQSQHFIPASNSTASNQSASSSSASSSPTGFEADEAIGMTRRLLAAVSSLHAPLTTLLCGVLRAHVWEAKVPAAAELLVSRPSSLAELGRPFFEGEFLKNFGLKSGGSLFLDDKRILVERTISLACALARAGVNIQFDSRIEWIKCLCEYMHRRSVFNNLSVRKVAKRLFTRLCGSDALRHHIFDA
eukprot:156768_1